MKKYILLISLLFVLLPLRAWNTAALERAVYNARPDDRPLARQYAPSLAVYSHRAIRLGYEHFHERVNTPLMTQTDKEIAFFIQQDLQRFFNRMEEIAKTEHLSPAQLQAKYSSQFVELLTQLATLFYKNQQVYTHLLFMDDHAALEETLKIVQEALEVGHF